MSEMTRVRIAGSVLLVVLGAGLFVRITNRADVPSKKPEPVPVATGMVEGPADTVDAQTGNLHLTVPILAASKSRQ